MTSRSDDSDDRGSDVDPTDSGSGGSQQIYRRPRRRGGPDLRDDARISDDPGTETQSDEDASSGGIYARPRRRSVRRDDDSKPGIFSRITGRHRLDEIREARYEPYTYESNEQNLKWAMIAMGIWCLVLVWLAFTDCTNSRQYEGWVEEGVTTIPPSAELTAQIESSRTFAQREGGEEFECAYLAGRSSTDECPDGETDALLVSSFVEESGAICTNFGEYVETTEEEVPNDQAVTTGLSEQESEPIEICTAVWSYFRLLEFAKQSGLDCPDVNAILTSISTNGLDYPDCDRAFTYAEEFQRSQDSSRLLWLLTVFLVVFVAFPYLSLLHRASRNLLPLNSHGQKHTPEWGVLHHFIPIMNFFRPGQVMMELYRGSDPDVSTDDVTAWKRAGTVRGIVFVWWALWIVAWLFNPIWGLRVANLILSIAAWIIEPLEVPGFLNPQSLPEAIGANDLLILSDVLLIVLGVVAILMLRQLHYWQEMRFSKIGLITVTPPPPADPLAEALKKQEEKQRAKEEKKNRRGR